MFCSSYDELMVSQWQVVFYQLVFISYEMNLSDFSICTMMRHVIQSLFFALNSVVIFCITLLDQYKNITEWLEASWIFYHPLPDQIKEGKKHSNKPFITVGVLLNAINLHSTYRYQNSVFLGFFILN